MNRYFTPCRTSRAWTALLLLIPVLAEAQSAYEGIYIGTFHGPLDDGQFALIVDDRDRGMFAVYDAADDYGFTESNVRIRSDGAFQLVTRQGYRIDGQVAAGGISGHYTADNAEGTFAGQRAADEGPLADAAGYYSGPVSITRTESGKDVVINSRLVAIVAADGEAFFVLDRGFPNFAAFAPFDVDFDWPFGFGRFFRGWPFDLDLDFGIHVPFINPFRFDFDFRFNLPTYGFAWPWNPLLKPLRASGGIIRMAPDGRIQDSLLDGLVLQGDLDPVTASVQGALFQQHGATVFSGTWFIERRPVGGFRSTKHYNRLADFDGDGRADILWRHAVTGENAVWLMNGADVEAELPLEIEQDSNWALVAVEDFGDDRQPDLVWQHQIGGEISVWSSDDEHAVRIPLDPAWRVIGSGDFDADARPEIFVRHSATGENALIVDPIGQAALVPIPAMQDRAWSTVAVADFDGDANPDVLWENQRTADLLIWQMKGRTPTRAFQISPETSGQLAGVGDFDGDGSADILCRDLATGVITITSMINERGSAEVQLDASPGLEWQVAGVGDLDGDGTDDLAWRHGLTGENVVWRVVDARVVGSGSLTPVPDVHWKIRP